MNADFDLDAIRYLPALRSRQAELRGYRELRTSTKTALRPIIGIGRLGRLGQCSAVLERTIEAVDGHFFLDLNVTSNQHCDDLSAISDPADNFKAWRELAKEAPKAVPLALLREDASERALVRQALAIEEQYGVVAVRSRRPAADLSLLQSVLSAVEDVDNLLLILDFGYIRATLEAREVEAQRIISALRLTEPSARVAVIASSFPKAVAAYGDSGGALEIIERELHARIGGDDVAIYGDHAAIYPDPFEPQIVRFVPRIDYCTFDAWIYRRRRVEDGGYTECARKIMELPEWENEFVDIAWGAKMIADAAKLPNDPPKGFGSPAAWIAARVNMHIERQSTLPDEVDDEDEEA